MGLRLADFSEEKALEHTLKINRTEINAAASATTTGAKAQQIAQAIARGSVGNTKKKKAATAAKVTARHRRLRCMQAGCNSMFQNRTARTIHMAAVHGRDVRPWRPHPDKKGSRLTLTSEDSAKFIAHVQKYKTAVGYLTGRAPGAHLQQAGA